MTQSISRPTPDQLRNTDTTGKSIGDTIRWNGSKWVAGSPTASLSFAVATFTDGESSTLHEIGSGTWRAVGTLELAASFTNGPATSASVSCSQWIASVALAGTTGPTVNTEAVAFPASPGTVVLTVTAAKSSETATKTITHTFANNVFWGTASKATGFTEADVEALSSAVSAAATRALTDIATAEGTYFVWASRVAAGTRTFKDTNTGFAIDMRSPETVSITNASGYTEDYYVYASTYDNIGTLDITVS